MIKIPAETKPALWGFAGGAVAVTIVGFTWGGWMTGGKAEAAASTRADEAVVAALAPVCVANFRRAAEAGVNLAELRKAESWSRGEFIEKGGWATFTDAKAPERMSSVARACAELLTSA
jgi:hypothetical protein